MAVMQTDSFASRRSEQEEYGEGGLCTARRGEGQTAA